MQKPVYTCRVFSLYEETFTLGNGKVVTQSHIDHVPSVAIVALNEKQEVLLISQYRNAIKQDLLEIPAGSMDKGSESSEASALRELAEETGYTAKKMTRLFGGYSLPGYCNEYLHYYLAEDLIYQPLPQDDDEHIQLQPTPLAHALHMLRAGEIQDGKTAIGLLLTAQLLEERKKHG